MNTTKSFIIICSRTYTNGLARFAPFASAKAATGFCYPEYIDQEMLRIFEGMAEADYFRGLVIEDFAVGAAHVLAEINAVHPFREGNGRTQLTFLAMLMENAGLSFNADVLERERVLDAMIESFAGDETRLAKLITEIGKP